MLEKEFKNLNLRFGNFVIEANYRLDCLNMEKNNKIYPSFRTVIEMKGNGYILRNESIDLKELE